MQNLTRRTFLKTSAVAGAAGVIGTATTGFLTSCGGEKADLNIGKMDMKGFTVPVPGSAK